MQQPSKKVVSTYDAIITPDKCLIRLPPTRMSAFQNLYSSHALASAEQVIQAHESITLDPADFEAFLAALDKPAQANAALSRAFDRHNEQVER